MSNDIKITEQVKFNLWANKRLVSWLETNDEHLITQECPSSFSSILKTLDHLLEGQTYYLSVLMETPADKPHYPSVQSMYTGLVEQSITFLDYVKSQASLEETRLVDSKFIKGSFPQYELIQHCMNHSTYHRGQIVTMGHQLGLSKAPSTDMLFYFFKRNQGV